MIVLEYQRCYIQGEKNLADANGNDWEPSFRKQVGAIQETARTNWSEDVPEGLEGSLCVDLWSWRGCWNGHLWRHISFLLTISYLQWIRSDTFDKKASKPRLRPRNHTRPLCQIHAEWKYTCRDVEGSKVSTENNKNDIFGGSIKF